MFSRAKWRLRERGKETFAFNAPFWVIWVRPEKEPIHLSLPGKKVKKTSRKRGTPPSLIRFGQTLGKVSPLNASKRAIFYVFVLLFGDFLAGSPGDDTGLPKSCLPQFFGVMRNSIKSVDSSLFLGSRLVSKAFDIVRSCRCLNDVE